MGLLDNIIILALIELSFFAGKHISDKYHEKIESEYNYLVRLNEARYAARDGVGYIAPIIKEQRQQPIDEQFMDHLKKNGRAIKQIRHD